MKKKQTIILAAVLVTLCLAAGILYNQFKPQTSEGEKNITVTVIHGDESSKEFSYTTDAEYLGDILQAEGLISGDQGEYGLYVKVVDGEEINETNQEWWCLTKGGESVNTGVDMTPIADGDTYELTFTVGY